MSTLTELSREDHKKFRRLQQVAVKAADELEKDNKVPVSDLIRIVTIIYEFIEGVHHKREETLYFPLIVSHDASLKSETDKFTSEHQFGRNTVGKLADDIANFADKGDTEKEPVVRYLRAYAGHIEPHLKQEEEFLRRVEDGILPKEEDAKYFEEYKKDTQTNTHAELMFKLLDLLETRPWYLD